MAGLRDRRASYAARDALYRDAGFSSYGQARRLAARLGLPGPSALFNVRSRHVYDALPSAARERYDRSVHALADVRSGKEFSFDQAVGRQGVAPAAARRWVSGGLRTIDGHVFPTRADRLYRRMTVIEAGGRLVQVDVRGSRAASAVGQYGNAVDMWLDVGDDSGLRAMAGTRIGGIEVETDADVISALAFTGRLRNFSPYPEAV
jgi:hypothetical protein